jgi:hypothetical protein
MADVNHYPPVIPFDTSTDVWRMQVSHSRSLSMQERAQRAEDKTQQMARTVDQAIRRTHPEFSEYDVRREYIRRRHGDALATAAETYLRRIFP